MSMATDARMRRSRSAIHSALLCLIEMKPYESISVREIAAEAGVSFPTFYRQFSSKQALLDDIAVAEIDALLAVTTPLLSRRDARPAALAICRFVLERKVLWRTLLTTGATAALRETFIVRSRAIALSRELRNPELPTDLMSALIASGLVEVLAWWLRNLQDYPLEVVAELLETLVLWPSNKRISIGFFQLDRTALKA